jgi:predicted CxxxxCH...CXXCH cytochrome family protein
MAKSETIKCHFCPTMIGGAGTINGPHWTGTEYIRVDLCNGCHAAGKLKSAPRRNRQPRETPVYAATDWNMLMAFHQRKRP